METRKLVGAALVLVVVVGVLVVFIGLPAVQTTFHYERNYPVDETKYVYFETNVVANISVTFIDDPLLMYSVDVIQNTPGSQHYITHSEHEDHLNVYLMPMEDAPALQSVNIVLGTGTYYEIIIYGANINVSVVFDNGAVLQGQEFVMSASGSLSFELTEDVSFLNNGLEVTVQTHVDVALVVDLPPGLNGRLETASYSTLGAHTMTGWSLIDTNTWATPSVAQPLLDIFMDTFLRVNFDLSD